MAYTEILYQQNRWILGNQLFKSGTSIGANIREAQHAESRVDFVHKMKIAAKEAEETMYWLLLCRHTSSAPHCEDLMQELEEIQRMLTSIIHTSKSRLKNPPL